jgi:hypothetical protein
MNSIEILTRSPGSDLEVCMGPGRLEQIMFGPDSCDNSQALRRTYCTRDVTQVRTSTQRDVSRAASCPASYDGTAGASLLGIPDWCQKRQITLRYL